MWNLELTTDYIRDHKWYEKKRRRELIATLANVDLFLQCLRAGARPQDVKFGFIHPEPGGVLAIDQSGGKGKLQETRLYTYPHEKAQILHLLRIGDKQSQPTDIAASKSDVLQIKARDKSNDQEKNIQ